MKIAHILACIALGACIVNALPASASTYNVAGDIQFTLPSPSQAVVLNQFNITNSPVTIGRGVSDDQPGIEDYHAQASAIAEHGALHAHTFTQIIHGVRGASTEFQEYEAFAYAYETINDMFISAPAGSPATVQAALTFHLDGDLLLSYYVPLVGGSSRSIASMQFTVSVGSDADGGFRTIESVDGAAPFLNTTGMGMLSGFTGNNDLTTKLFTLPVNTPFSMFLSFNVLSDIAVDFHDSFIASANADFTSTLSFATDVPVFDLPAGYTANSADGAIFNNQFIGAPEPGSLAALAMGIIALTAKGRRPTAPRAK